MESEYHSPLQPSARRLLDLLGDPERLEHLFQKDPTAFRAALKEASLSAGDSDVIRVWNARLSYQELPRKATSTRLWYALGIAAVVGALVRIPAIWLDEAWYYPRFAPLLVILGLSTYFWLQNRDKGKMIVGLALAGIVSVYVSLIPGGADYSDSVIMALLHVPILFWAFLGIVFTGESWRGVDSRIRYVGYNGELLVLGALLGLGGIVFSAITVGLFELITEQPEEWYFANVGLIGAAAVPVAATYLYDVVLERRIKIASVLARIFSPLFLIMSCAYLVGAFLGGQNPFMDREFLIIFNGLLVVVLGMTVLSIAARSEQAKTGWVDSVNVALLIVTLLIDLIALSAIVFRLTSFGFTPNRVVVLGANLVIMVHLVWACLAYVNLIRGKSGSGPVRRAVAAYLPVYVAWAALVVFVLPLLFKFS